MKKQFTLNLSLTLVLLSLTAVSQLKAAETSSGTAVEAKQPAPPKQEQIAADLRDRLSPFIEAALQEHCGEDCPSFRIDPQFKKATTDSSLDDLGFSKPSQPEGAPELQSVSVSVLIQDKVSQKARESLRKILANRVTNQANVPVVVRMMTLDAFAPLMERRMHADAAALAPGDKIGLVKAFSWPVCLLLFAAIAFLALTRVLKHRKEILLEKLASQKATNNADVAIQKQEEVVEAHSMALDLLQKRIDDLHWLIENAALRSDMASIQKIVSMFPAQEITSRIRLSREALFALASAAESGQKTDAKAVFSWISSALDQAHWGRMEEQADRLSRVRRFPAERAKKVFSRLSSVSMKAAFITALSEERWPELLATLGSEERVQLGLTLADYAAATPEIRATLASQLSQELSEVDDSLKSRSETALESFALYLSEKEGQKLWQELSIRSAGKRPGGRLTPVSIDSMFTELDPSAAAEVCTRLDVGTLSIILTQVSGEVRAKIYQNLPKTLQARLNSSSTPDRLPSEAAQMKARALLLETYRQFTAGSMVQ